MTGSELSKALSEFKDRVLYDGSGSVEEGQQGFQYSDMLRLISLLPGRERLVIIHLGLDKRSMRYGFSFVESTEKNGTSDYDIPLEPTHILENNAFAPIAAAAWQKMHDAYFDHVYLKRGIGAAEKVDRTDARMVILHWDKELDRMYQETTRNVKDSFRLMLSSVSVEHDAKDGGHAGYRHSVSFHCEQQVLLSWNPMLNDDHDPAAIFRFKAADYGNLCPPRCGKFQRS